MSCQYDKLANVIYGNSQYSETLFQVVWHFTNICELDCKLCFSKALRSENAVLTTAQIDDTFFLFKQLGVQKVDLSGGEPLLHPLFPYIATHCKDTGIIPTITTSGFGLEDNINWLENNCELFSRIIVSLDGPASIHNMLRGNPSAFNTFLSFYERLSRKCCDKLRINTVVSKPVLIHCANLIEIINRLKPLEWCCIQPHSINKLDSFDLYNSTSSDFEVFVKECSNKMGNSPVSFLTRTNADYSSYWVLYPNHRLCHLTPGNSFDEDYLFKADNIQSIRAAIKKHPQSYVHPLLLEKS